MSQSDSAEATRPEQELDPELIEKIVTLRAQMREGFGKIVMAVMALPRYRHHSIADLQPLVLEPLMRDGLALLTELYWEFGDAATRGEL